MGHEPNWLEGSGGEEVECAFGFEVIGDPLAEGLGIGVESGLGVELDHGFAVGSDNLGIHAPLVVLGDAVGPDRERAAAAEGVEVRTTS